MGLFNVKNIFIRSENTNKLQLLHLPYPNLYKQENQTHQLQICILHKLTKIFTIYRIFSIFKEKALKYISLILFLDTNIAISIAIVYKTNKLGE
ncbi:hypothetical protein BC30090_2925 [Bacillus cereus]|nr:hypothetical protein BKK41_11340 [Bacillus cereus]BCD24028.1 hypothetical protein BC30090_2925 [Bacillus cereus]